MTARSDLARATLLAAWAAFFAMLWLTGDGHRYLGSRTFWVIPFGAFATALVAGALTLRGQSRAPIRRGEAVAIGLLLLPIIVALTAPDAELGSAAAERRAAGTGVVQLRPVGGYAGRAISYADIMAADGHPEAGPPVGTPVRLIGFVMQKPGTPPGMFQVARFYLTCCVADATVLYATVEPHGDVPPRDAWLDLTGRLVRSGDALIVDAERMRQIPAPDHPYLSSSGTATALPAVGGGTRPPDPSTARQPAPYRAPKPPPAILTLPSASASAEGLRVKVSKVEYAATETRVFAVVTNTTRKPMRIFPSNSSITGATTATAGGQSVVAMNGSAGRDLLPSTVSARSTVVGILTFPKLDSNARLSLDFDALSSDPGVGDHGYLKIRLRW
jgi:uncharacterized repeat protein (TIGR03943 family)